MVLQNDGKSTCSGVAEGELRPCTGCSTQKVTVRLVEVQHPREQVAHTGCGGASATAAGMIFAEGCSEGYGAGTNIFCCSLQSRSTLKYGTSQVNAC